MLLDTSPKALAVQRAVFRQMSTEERLRLALEMSDSMRAVTLSGLRERRPDLGEEQLARELMRLMYGSVPSP